jgi:hypothetical protein
MRMTTFDFELETGRGEAGVDRTVREGFNEVGFAGAGGAGGGEVLRHRRCPRS